MMDILVNMWHMVGAVMGAEQHRREHYEMKRVEEALHRCGFNHHLDMFRKVIITNAAGEELNADEQKQLVAMMDTVREEYRLRAIEAKRCLERQAAEDKARRQAEYDRIAAPYREQRRLRLLKRIKP